MQVLRKSKWSMLGNSSKINGGGDTPTKNNKTMKKYFVHCTHKETKHTYLLGTTDTEIEAIAIRDYAMRDDAKHGESDDYEYEIKHK